MPRRRDGQKKRRRPKLRRVLVSIETHAATGHLQSAKEAQRKDTDAVPLVIYSPLQRYMWPEVDSIVSLEALTALGPLIPSKPFGIN